MIPQFMPTHWFSAICETRAMAGASHGQPDTAANARATTSSKAADDESPAPIGTSPASMPSQPTSA